MKINIKAVLITVLLISLTFIVFSQTEGELTPPPEGASFPLWAFLPLFFGMLLHWGKGFTRGTITSSLGNYIIDNISLTISALTVGVGQLITAWATAPTLFETNPYFVVWTIFLMGYGSDSALNGSGPFIKKQ